MPPLSRPDGGLEEGVGVSLAGLAGPRVDQGEGDGGGSVLVGSADAGVELEPSPSAVHLLDRRWSTRNLDGLDRSVDAAAISWSFDFFERVHARPRSSLDSSVASLDVDGECEARRGRVARAGHRHRRVGKGILVLAFARLVVL